MHGSLRSAVAGARVAVSAVRAGCAIRGIGMPGMAAMGGMGRRAGLGGMVRVAGACSAIGLAGVILVHGVNRVVGASRIGVMSGGRLLASGTAMSGVIAVGRMRAMSSRSRVRGVLGAGRQRCKPEQQHGEGARMPAHAPSSTRTSRIMPASMW